MKINLELDLNDPLYEDGTSLRDLIVKRASAQLLEHVQKEGNAWPTLRGRVEKMRDDEIRAALLPVIGQAVAEAVQPTNTFGEPRGEPVTLRGLIVKEAREQLKQSGRDRRHPSSDRRGATLLEHVIAHEVEGALGKELRAELEAAKADVKVAVREKGAEVIAEAIAGRLTRP